MSNAILFGFARSRAAKLTGLILSARSGARMIGAVVLAALVCASSLAQSAELRVLSAAAVQSVFKEIIGDFERQSGHRLNIDYATMGAIHQRIMAGETAGLVIGSTPSVTGLVEAGRLRRESEVTIAKVGVGIVVPRTHPKPQIASVEDFTRALRAARVIVYADPAGGGAAGTHIAKIIDRLGL